MTKCIFVDIEEVNNLSSLSIDELIFLGDVVVSELKKRNKNPGVR